MKRRLPQLNAAGGEVLPLGELVQFLDGARRPIKASERQPGPYPYFGANGQVDSVAGFLFDEKLVLLAEDGGFFEDPHKPISYLVEGKCWVNNHAHVIRAGPRLVPEYLNYQLAYADVMPLISGTTRAKLTKGDACRIPILCPALADQHRVVDLLSRAEGIVRLRRQAQQKAAALIPAIFVDMFGDPATNPKGWPIRPFGELVINRDGARRPVKSADRAARQGQYPYYGASGVIDRVDDYIFEGPHLLIAEDGANLLSRSTPIAFQATGKYWVNNHAHVVAQKSGATLTYLEVALNLRDLRDYVTGSAQPKLTQANLNAIPIAVPPEHVQRSFVARAAQVLSVRRQQADALEKAEKALHSLLSRAFAQRESSGKIKLEEARA